MTNTKVCQWLVENGDVAVRYRVYKELLNLEDEAEKVKQELHDTNAVKHWLRLLKPETPPQHRSMLHGSFDFCFENALPKLMQLGFDASFEQLREAVGFYFNLLKQVISYNSDNNLPYRKDFTGFTLILAANLLLSAGFTDTFIIDCLLKGLDEMSGFIKQGSYDLYISDDERSRLKAVPKNWVSSKFIKSEITDNYGFVYPLIYDIMGMYKLYELNKSEVTDKVNDIIKYISCDEFHSNIVDGYGILIYGDKKYYSMGWDPKYPGWSNVNEYMEADNARRLLFFAQRICKYPSARQTKWYCELIDYLEGYKTENDTYIFPVNWFKEQPGYAVMGSHLSFGENRKKKNWCEIESTLYMQQLLNN